MSPLLRTAALLFTSALVGCATTPPPPQFTSTPDGCGVMNAKTGQIISPPPIECLAQKQLQAEAANRAAVQKAQIAGTATLTKTIVQQPLSKNPQAQNMGTIIGILKLDEMARQSGLDPRAMRELLPDGWTPRLVEQAARLVRSTFNGQCSRDMTNNSDTCFDKAAPVPATPASAARP